MRLCLFMTCNASYLQHFMVAVQSLFDNHHPSEISLTVAYHPFEIGEDKITIHEDVIDMWLAEFTGLEYTINPCLVMDKGLVERQYFSRHMYERFAAARHCPDDDKILYLDSDILVRGRLDGLFNTDISNHFLAACTIPGSVNMSELCGLDQAPYFNSGMMLINAAKWREFEAETALTHTAIKTADHLKFPDQDVLNLVFYDLWLPVSPIWNAIRPYFIGSETHGLTREAMLDIADQAVIIHYNSRFKPWQYMDNHPAKGLYWHYLKATPFKGYVPKDKTIANQIKKALLWLAPSAVKNKAKAMLGWQDHRIDDSVSADHAPLTGYFLKDRLP